MNRQDFPFFSYHPEVAYLDNAATTQRPKVVIDAIEEYYYRYNTSIHRSNYGLAYEATQKYEIVRQKTATLINAESAQEILFTKGTTQSLNWIAFGYGLNHLKPGQEIVVSSLEHHSNLVVWQQVAKRTGAILKFIELDASGNLDINSAKRLISSKTKIVAVSGLSNVLGNKTPLDTLAKLAHAVKAVFVVDGAQLVGHDKIDVQKTEIDFLAFSAHKMYGPTGIGVLYGRQDLLNQLEPLEFGGEMVDVVTKNETTFAEIPYRFEAGTQNPAGVFGFGAAIDYLNNIGFEKISEVEINLGQYLADELRNISGVDVYGPIKRKSGIVSFNIDGVHAHDVATFLDAKNIYIRAGKHCAEPLLNDLGVSSAVRASLSFYNSKEECNRLVTAVKEVQEFFNYG